MKTPEHMRSGNTANSHLQKIVNEYLKNLEIRRFAPATVDKRRDSLRKFLLFLESVSIDRFQDVTLCLLEEYRSVLADNGYSPYSNESYLCSARLFFRWLTEQGALFENPADLFHIRKPVVKLGNVLTEDQAKAILNAPDLSKPCGIRDRAMLEILYTTGMRRSELTALTVRDINLESASVRVKGKGCKERLLPLGKCTAKYLTLYLRRARPELVPDQPVEPLELWFTRLKNPLSKNNFALIVRRHAEAAGIPFRVTTHTLRRSCATHLLRNGAHPAAVAALLGHSDLRSLAHYLKVNISDIRETHLKTKPGR